MHDSLFDLAVRQLEQYVMNDRDAVLDVDTLWRVDRFERRFSLSLCVEIDTLADGRQTLPYSPWMYQSGTANRRWEEGLYS